jgi:hypothetical protein
MRCLGLEDELPKYEYGNRSMSATKREYVRPKPPSEPHRPPCD